MPVPYGVSFAYHAVQYRTGSSPLHRSDRLTKSAQFQEFSPFPLEQAKVRMMCVRFVVKDLDTGYPASVEFE